MFGENLGTGTLLDSVKDYIGYVRIDYESGDYAAAEQNAKSLMHGAMELWQRMVELREEGETE